MTDRRRYRLEELAEEIREIDQALANPVTDYLIGGGAMSFADLKAATKDIDVVVDGAPPFERLTEALEASGYTPTTDPQDAYASLGAAAYYDKEAAPRWDVYVGQVCNCLLLSPGMIDRSSRLDLGLDRLDLRRVGPADVFIFKSITERDADREDMEEIFAQGLDWATVLEEMRWQIEHSDRAWSVAFHETLDAFSEEGRSVPILDELEALVETDVGEARVLQLVENGVRSREAILDEVDEEPDWVRGLIEQLIQQGRLREENGLLDRPT